MIVVALVCLSLALWIIFRQQQHVMMMFYLSPYRNKRDFMALYDLHDNQADLEEMVDHTSLLGTYAAFLKLHQSGRKDAYGTFKTFWDVIVRILIRDYLIAGVLCIPIVLYGVVELFFAVIVAFQVLVIALELYTAPT